MEVFSLNAWTEEFGLRELLRLVLLSGLSTVICLLVYPRNAPTRRLLVLCAVGALTALPLLLVTQPLVLELPMQEPLAWRNAVPLWLLWLWFGLAIPVCVARIVRSYRCQAQLLDTPVYDDEALNTLTAELATQHGLAHPVQVRCGTVAVPGPSSGTLLGPLLVLPEDAKRWPAKTTRAVICHEFVHIKRRDDVWMLMVRVVCGLYWWMPWMRLLYDALERAVEESCDDYASEHFGEELGYIDGLVDGAGRCTVEAPPPNSFAHLGRHPMFSRVRRFGRERALELDSRGAYWALIGTLLTVLVVTSFKPVALDEGRAVWVAPAGKSEHQPIGALTPQVFARLTGFGASTYRPETPRPMPIYPGAALLDGIEGEVVLEFEVARDGRAYRTRVVSAQPNELFVPASLKALAATRYNKVPQSPALDQGSLNTPMTLRQVYIFRVRQI